MVIKLNENNIQEAVRFHGHLGPFLVLGLKMGKFAKEYINPRDFKDIEVEIFIHPFKTPESCIIDGIQFSSGCTIGKKNLIIKESDKKEIKAIFRGNNKELNIKVKDLVVNIIKHKLSDHHGAGHSHGTIEDVAKEIIDKNIEDLFDYEKK